MSIPTRQELAEQIAKAERQRDAELAALLRERLKQLGVPVGPEAACFPAYLGQTEL